MQVGSGMKLEMELVEEKQEFEMKWRRKQSFGSPVHKAHTSASSSPILRGGRVAVISLNMRWDMVPWSIAYPQVTEICGL